MTVGSIPGMGSIPNLPGFLSYDQGNDGRCPYIWSITMCLARSNMRARGHRIQPPGVTQRVAHDVRALPGTMRIEQLDPVVRSAWFLWIQLFDPHGFCAFIAQW